VEFIFATCQVGAETAVKAEVARDWPALRFAYSRPGFLTFKLPPDHGFKDDWRLEAVFARASGFSLGKTTAESMAERVADVWRMQAQHDCARLHVWQRDLGPPDRVPELLQPSPVAVEAEAAIRHAAPTATHPLAFWQPTRRGDKVLDCVLVEPDQWWIGMHRAAGPATCWPGGSYFTELPPDAVSRAYLKMEEALAWSRLPIGRGDLCTEIGSAPGGASQALLNRGATVIGVDPADMDERVLAHPRFTHIKKRGTDVRRREFRKVRWLTADINIAPNYTLDTVEAIVTHSDVHVQGMLLTLKLLDWSLTAAIPAYLERVRSWGFANVAARQLHHNRQEICVAASRK
jgi:23S rRNA (cytidine2498-2'-O)-methyltransferase